MKEEDKELSVLDKLNEAIIDYESSAPTCEWGKAKVIYVCMNNTCKDFVGKSRMYCEVCKGEKILHNHEPPYYIQE